MEGLAGQTRLEVIGLRITAYDVAEELTEDVADVALTALLLRALRCGS